MVLKQLGIWRPIYRAGHIMNWELYVTDYDDNQVAVVQVTEEDDQGYPLRMIRTSFESGFNRENRLQKSEVISTVLIRQEM